MPRARRPLAEPAGGDRLAGQPPGNSQVVTAGEPVPVWLRPSADQLGEEHAERVGDGNVVFGRVGRARCRRGVVTWLVVMAAIRDNCWP